MRLYNEETGQYIQALASAINKDPASLDSWRCMHIHPAEPQLLDKSMIEVVKEAHKDLDCDIVICPDNDILLISREMSKESLESLAGAITINMLEQAPEIASYDLFLDWRRIRVLLMSKTSDTKSSYNPVLESNNFGEIKSLTDVFSSAKKLRKVRQPQFVMVVEDDPLTRRIVANAFKENYALITACNAEEAIANYLLHAPDVVFLDIGLPDVSGFAVLKQIIASDPDAYVIMFSANSYLDNITKSLAAGASGFVSKPFRKEKLLRYIEDSAHHHRKHME